MAGGDTGPRKESVFSDRRCIHHGRKFHKVILNLLIFIPIYLRKKLDRYHLKADETLSVFEFISVGPNGAIRKIIDFQPTALPGLYNLAFGDKHPTTGEIDDLAISNNGDTDKVSATVVTALYVFLDKNPEALVYATGSTPARTRLYRMGITRFYEEMQQDFILFGRIGEEFYGFEIGIEYAGFLAQRKFE